MKSTWRKIFAAGYAMFYAAWALPPAQAYSFNEIIPDVRKIAALSGGSACPVRSHHLIAPANIAVRWSTALNANPVTILTQAQSPDARLNEIEQTISQSMAVWTNVSGTSLTSASFTPLTRTAAPNSCGSDGLNSICFDQADAAFTPGVLAFTRVIAADSIGAQIGNGMPATEVGQILDADIYFSPSDSRTRFATATALASTPSAYDLESALTHELGHLLGFSHSAVWDAMMFPFAAAPGTFAGVRPTPQRPDAPLGEDDRTGLRVLYPDLQDVVHIGSIVGRILPANPLSLPAAPTGVTGIFGSNVVAVDAVDGSVVGATLGGWSCSGAGPVQFDGQYRIERLQIGRQFNVYAEALNGAVDPSQISDATGSLCRNASTDPGWPPAQGCVTPAVNVTFTTRLLAAP
jgi:hypothetical protein